MNIQQQGILVLIKSGLTGEKAVLPEGFEFANSIEIAKKHQISTILYYGALNCRVSQELPEMQKLFLSVCQNIACSEQQMHEINNIFSAFSKAEIEYMPLKGTLLKKIYPKSEMRTMSDADILIRMAEYEKIRDIMLDLGFAEGEVTDHEIKWHKPWLYVELHSRIIPSYNKDYYAYFGDGWRLAKKCDGTRYSMTDEDQMIYLFTHLAKHYRNGGIGIKHMTDLWVYKSKIENLNEAYIAEELQKLQLSKFYKNIMYTLDVWFADSKTIHMTDFITDFIFESGAYGTKKNRIIADGVKTAKVSDRSAVASRFKRICDMIFLPYSGMCIKYNILKRIPVLLPVFWGVRWCDTLLNKRKNLDKLTVSINDMTVKNIESFSDALNYVGLDFNFKE